MISDRPPRSYPRVVAAIARPLATGTRALLPTLVCLCGMLALGAAGAQAQSFIAGFSPNTLASTVPANGDVNPYGIVTVPVSVRALKQGDLLVSSFNNSANQQGTGDDRADPAR